MAHVFSSCNERVICLMLADKTHTIIKQYNAVVANCAAVQDCYSTLVVLCVYVLVCCVFLCVSQRQVHHTRMQQVFRAARTSVWVAFACISRAQEYDCSTGAVVKNQAPAVEGRKDTGEGVDIVCVGDCALCVGNCVCARAAACANTTTQHKGPSKGATTVSAGALVDLMA